MPSGRQDTRVVHSVRLARLGRAGEKANITSMVMVELNTRVVVRAAPGVHPDVVLLGDLSLYPGDDSCRGTDSGPPNNPILGHLLLNPLLRVRLEDVLGLPGRVGEPESPEPRLVVSSQTSVHDDL